MAWMLAGLMAHLGEITVKNGVISALFVWFGFVATTLAVNKTCGMRSPKLILIDGGHWLAALLLMGAVIGAWGVEALITPDKSGTIRALSVARMPSHNAQVLPKPPGTNRVAGRKIYVRKD